MCDYILNKTYDVCIKSVVYDFEGTCLIIINY